MKKTMILAIFSICALPARASNPAYIWCSAVTEAGTRVLYSDLFPMDNSKTGKDYANMWGDYLKSQNKKVDGPAGCHVVPQGLTYADGERRQDMQHHTGPMQRVSSIHWDPRTRYVWCSAIPAVMDKTAYQHPYSDIFLYDDAQVQKLPYENRFMNYLMEKTYRETNSKVKYLPHCTVTRGEESLAMTSRDRWLRQESGGKDEPKETHWKP